MVDDSEGKFHGCYLIIAFINTINLKVLGGYGIWTSLHLPCVVFICNVILTVILLSFRVLAFADVVSAV